MRVDATLTQRVYDPVGPVLFHPHKLAGPQECKILFGPMVQRLDPSANDPLASMPPAFSDEAARQVLHDGFGLTGSLTALAGERDQNFRVDTADGQRFLFKISNPADTLPILDQLPELRLAVRGRPLPELLQPAYTAFRAPRDADDPDGGDAASPATS